MKNKKNRKNHSCNHNEKPLSGSAEIIYQSINKKSATFNRIANLDSNNASRQINKKDQYGIHQGWLKIRNVRT
jgi:hypothetical protein